MKSNQNSVYDNAAVRLITSPKTVIVLAILVIAFAAAATAAVIGGQFAEAGALGAVLYRESAELAQSALRHRSIRTTHDAYSHIDAGETAEEVGSVLDEARDGGSE